jgi:glycosyltransferase involved in cell wall biosynthesis
MPPWFVGGKEERLRQIKKNVSHDDFQVIFATMRWWDGAAPNQHVAICKKIKIYKKGRRSILNSLYFAISCFKIVRLRPDLVEADQMPFLPIWPLKLVCLALRIPLCVTWHEVWGSEYWNKYLGRWGFIAAGIERISMKLPDKIIAVSEMTKARLIAAGVKSHKISVIPNSVNCDEIRNSSTNLYVTDLLYVGRLISHKRVDLLLEAIAILNKEGIYTSLTIIGTGPELDNLRVEATEKLQQEQIVFYSEYLDSKDIWGMMAKCKIFVSASEREGYGIAVLEALTAGAKVLVSSHEDNAARFLVTNEVGKIVPQQTPRAWADSIKFGLTAWNGLPKSSKYSVPTEYDFGLDYSKIWSMALENK